MSSSEWSGIRAAYEAGRHAAYAVDGGYQARNPGQRWRTRFDGRGFTVQPDAGGWEWGLELERWGFAGDEHAPCEPVGVSAAGARVVYEWDGILAEWYENDARGLEHGYTVRERPARGASGERGPLVFTLAVRGELRAEVLGAGRDVRFVDERGGSVLSYAGLLVHDADGQELPAGFERSAEGLLLSIDERGARYPLTIDPLAQQAYLKASNPELNDFFGWSVAVSGDTVVVGAEREDSGASGVNGNQSDNSVLDSGAAYVFVRDGTGWSQEAYLKASNPGAFDRFGRTVAVSGDTVVIGADREDSDGVNGEQDNDFAPDAGAAYVFVRNGTSWSQQAYLKASNAAVPPFPGDQFGCSVAVSGDTLIVGALNEDSDATGVNGNPFNNNALGSGAAFVFVRNGTVWSQQAYLKASNTGSDDAFGFSVSISGESVVVGAPGEDSNATGVGGDQADNGSTESGAAYVFARAGSAWSQQAYLKHSINQANRNVGRAVAMSGDTALIGETDNLAVAEVFVREDETWSFQARLEPSGAANWGSCIGATTISSLALSGDIAVIGDHQDASDATGVNGAQNNLMPCAGAAYVFRRSGTTWNEEAYLKASNTELHDQFGTSVAVSGNTIVVGAHHEDSASPGVNGKQADNSAQASGAAYVFEICAPPSVAFRNGGTNPVSYAADPIAIGGTFTATVDNNVAGQLTSALIAFDSPFTVTLGGGQTLLCLDLGGSGEQFTGAGLYPSSSAGGIDSFSLPFANDPSTCGVVYHSQALQYGNPPFVLSNAQDLTIGTF